VASLYVSPKAVPVAVSLFAFAGSLVYYSSETKQYSADVAVSVVLLWLVWRLSSRSVSTAELLGLSLGGSAAVWFSHPASFLLSGAGLALMCFAFVEHDWPYFRRLSYACGLWGLTFLACYVVSLHTLTRDQVLLDFWRNYFPPLPLWSWSNLSLLIERFFTTFSDPAGLVSIVGATIFVVGCIRLAGRNTVYFSLLALPVLTTLLGAFLHKYPLGGRFLLFLLPGSGSVLTAELTWHAIQRTLTSSGVSLAYGCCFPIAGPETDCKKKPCSLIISTVSGSDWIHTGVQERGHICTI
jgi:hypothetical protein